MGCTSSRQARFDRGDGPSPFSRSYSMPFHPSWKRHRSGNGRQHIVSLTSSTLGSIRLDDDSSTAAHLPASDHRLRNVDEDEAGDDEMMKKSLNDTKVLDLSSEVLRARTWSDTIARRIPKTPTMTPPNEPETINTWELMAGLEDVSPIRHPPPGVERSFSFHATLQPPDDERHHLLPQQQTKPKSPQNPSPPKPLFSKEQKNNEKSGVSNMSLVKARIMAFQERINARKANAAARAAAAVGAEQEYKSPPSGEKKVVLYLTSLRGIRKTYEDCCATQLILKGYGVRVDERDVSMDAGFKDELNDILGLGFGGLKLPRVFVNGQHLGGADEVRQMHETGEMAKALRSCEKVMKGKGGTTACETCGDMRFVPCETCNGSCKVFIEEEEEDGEDGEDEDEEAEERGGEFRRCQDCNENGLVRCPVCCSG